MLDTPSPSRPYFPLGQCFCPGLIHTLAARIPARIRLAAEPAEAVDGPDPDWDPSLQDDARPSVFIPPVKTATVDGTCCFSRVAFPP